MTNHERSERSPTVSYVGEDGSLVELLYDGTAEVTALARASADGIVSVSADIALGSGRVLVPYTAQNALIAHRCVLLPSLAGEERDKRDLLSEISAFLHRYVDLHADYELLATYYVLLSWVYDAFEVVPYLRARGDFGTGKTRALLAIGSLCYKPFFASGASTVSPIFHILDTFQGTLVLDEADFRFSDAASELTKILNNGNARGMPVLRTMSNRNRELTPQAFRVFGPKIVGMRETFEDDALESRFITIDMGSDPVRDDIPVQLPPAFHDEATDLRNRLLTFRLKSLKSIALDAHCAVATLDRRSNQVALPLLSLIDDEAERERVVGLLRLEHDRRRQDRSDTVEATVLTAALDAFRWARAEHVPLSEVAERFNRAACAEMGRPMSNRWIGGVLRKRLHVTTTKTRGVYAIPQTEKPKLDALARRYGVDDVEAGII